MRKVSEANNSISGYATVLDISYQHVEEGGGDRSGEREGSPARDRSISAIAAE